MIVAQLAAVFSMTVLSAWRSARQQRYRWLREVWPSLTSLVSSRLSGLVQRVQHRRALSHSNSETLNQLYFVSGAKKVLGIKLCRNICTVLILRLLL